jgi:hypothetical protein
MGDTKISNEIASEVFTAYALPFITSADKTEVMMNYSAIAITAWNLSGVMESAVLEGIERLETRLKCKELENFGKKEAIGITIKRLITLKDKEYSQYQFKVAGAQFVEEMGELRILVKMA